MNLRKLSGKNKAIALGASLALVLFIAAGLFLFLGNTPDTDTDDQIVHKVSFAFDTNKAPGWWSAGNTWPDPKELSGGDVPIASIIVPQGTKATPGACFDMAFYNPGTVDIMSTLKQREDGLSAGLNDPSLLTQIGTVQQTMQTPDGPKEYTVYQYNLNTPQAQQGNEFGFIKLTSGYIEVRGICATADQLQTTLTGLSAIRLNK